MTSVTAGGVCLRDAPRLEIGRGAAWLRFDGALVDLARRPVLRRVVTALIELGERAPGAVLSCDALFARGWPGQRIRCESARNRVYVALASLRRLGLRDALERRPDGYRIAAGVRIERLTR